MSPTKFKNHKHDRQNNRRDNREERQHFGAKKSFGQNFLTERRYLDEIVSIITQNTGDKNIFEIGTGTGALTKHLAAIAASKSITVTSIEIEKDVIMYLKTTPLYTDKSVNLIEGDFMRLKPEEYLNGCDLVVGNIPYYITSPIIEKLLDDNAKMGYPLRKIYLMTQQEVAERLVAKPHSRAYGKLTIFSQLRADISIAIDKIPPTAFNPPPKVYSAFVELSPYRENKYNIQDEQKFSRLVRIAFSQKRRTLRNCLIGGQIPIETIEKIYAELGLSNTARAEELDIETLKKISEMV
jgi:16S rRNA (adenine1518-N6/adenine1519-N6)-dimethyltransferase